jgi:hypothetical protein
MSFFKNETQTILANSAKNKITLSFLVNLLKAKNANDGQRMEELKSELELNEEMEKVKKESLLSHITDELRRLEIAKGASSSSGRKCASFLYIKMLRK